MLEGHSFIVGAAVSIGGRDIKPGINVHRFANRIPLLFEVQELLLVCQQSGLFFAMSAFVFRCWVFCMLGVQVNPRMHSQVSAAKAAATTVLPLPLPPPLSAAGRQSGIVKGL